MGRHSAPEDDDVTDVADVTPVVEIDAAAATDEVAPRAAPGRHARTIDVEIDADADYLPVPEREPPVPHGLDVIEHVMGGDDRAGDPAVPSAELIQDASLTEQIELIVDPVLDEPVPSAVTDQFAPVREQAAPKSGAVAAEESEQRSETASEVAASDAEASTTSVDDAVAAADTAADSAAENNAETRTEEDADGAAAKAAEKQRKSDARAAAKAEKAARKAAAKQAKAAQRRERVTSKDAQGVDSGNPSAPIVQPPSDAVATIETSVAETKPSDLALLRADSAARARVIAAVVVPFLVYVAVLLVIGEFTVRTALIWIWVPMITAGVVAGLMLDLGHRAAAARAIEALEVRSPSEPADELAETPTEEPADERVDEAG